MAGDQGADFRLTAVKDFHAIAAMSLNGVIGRGGGLPWHLPEDFRWFKKLTTGHVIVMGRKTFQSVGRPLPNRTTIVLSRSPQPIPGVRTLSDLRELDWETEPREVYICGGAQVYAQYLPYCRDLYLTLVKRAVEGDVFFPSFQERFAPLEIIQETPEFRIVRYGNTAVLPFTHG